MRKMSYRWVNSQDRITLCYQIRFVFNSKLVKIMFRFCLIVLLLEFQFNGIHSVPVICDVVDECELEKTFEEICDFAQTLCDDEIKNKVLEFLSLLKALPREKITKQRFNKGIPLVRAAFKGLKNDGISVKKKLDAMDALIGIMGLSPCSCYERPRPKLLEYWLETMAAFLCDNPISQID